MKIIDLSFAYEGKEVFSHLDLDLEGPVVCLKAPSGRGKTTLLKLIGGLLEPQGGKIEGAPAKPSFLFQEDRLLPWYDALHNVSLVAEEEKARELLEKLHIDPAARISSLSGGMKRRVALARTLAYEGDLLILDEPFKGMDSELITEAAELILAGKKPVLMSSHSPEEALRMGAKIIEF